MEKQEKIMKNAFEKQARVQLEQVIEDDSVKVGLEFEFGLLSRKFKQIGENKRDQLINEMNNLFNERVADKELGAAQLELRTKPFNLSSGFGMLEDYSVDLIKGLDSIAEKMGVYVVSLGSNPVVPIDKIKRTSEPKYDIVPGYHNQKQGKRFLENDDGSRIDVTDASVVSLLNSLQVNIQAKTLDDALDKCNRSFMLSPYFIAMGANASHLDFKFSGWKDLRMISWLKSHDIRTEKMKEYRIGLPNDYFDSIEDYFNDIKSFPFILGNENYAFQIGIGLYWKDARIKFINNYPIVEFRPMSIQPTIEEDLAMTKFYVGRLAYSQIFSEPLMPINLVKENRLNAMHYGLDGEMHFFDIEKNLRKGKARYFIGLELDKAVKGLNVMGINEDLEILRSRIIDGAPADRFISRVENLAGGQRKFLKDALKEVVENGY